MRWLPVALALAPGCKHEAAYAPARYPEPAGRTPTAESPRAGAPLGVPPRSQRRVPARQSATPPSVQALAERYGSLDALATLTGEASYYSDKLAGRHTANGERYDPDAATAAHRKLPFGTILRVTRVDDGSVTYVRVNDRGPYAGPRRILDLARAPAEDLGMLRAGVVAVRAEVLRYGAGRDR